MKIINMNRFIAVLLIVIYSACLAVPASALLPQDVGEGYAAPTYPEVIQTMLMMNGADISNVKIADEYGRLVYCDIYKKDYGNDVLWEKVRDEIITRAQKKKEYFRIKYEIVSVFYLGRYDFDKQWFPIDANKSSIENVGSLSLMSAGEYSNDCAGQPIYSSLFPMVVDLQLNEPLTIEGFTIPKEKVDRLIVRMEEAGDVDRRVYGRMRVVVDGAKGIDFSQNNTARIVLNGKVISVDFFIDPELTKPMASIHVNNE
jgi:hypothetical protein